ncbi:MAG: DUF4258 domain-containing protein [Candidatus Riflebacteria bacterium]|nr:DUF4258 domain-containing protein [Candidatus Riflebacteria bacterium]
MVKPENLSKIRNAAKKRLMFLPHAIQQMKLPERDIRVEDVINAIDHGQIIEDYPGDIRAPSSLLLGPDCHSEPIHVLCALREDYLAILTTYRPSEDCWTKDLRRRKK